MKLFRLQRTQRLAIAPEEAWRFFSDPANLAKITPKWLQFEVTGELPEEMHAGLIISYRLRPLGGWPLRWVTEITHARPPRFFVDEQRFGPYRFWHHQHHFRACGGGTEMTDVVHYALPLGPFGTLVQRLAVAGRLEQIFDFRREELSRRFGDLP